VLTAYLAWVRNRWSQHAPPDAPRRQVRCIRGPRLAGVGQCQVEEPEGMFRRACTASGTW
jgi:hypothetical protein